MSIASLLTDKNASANATDAEPELVPPVPLAAAPAGPGPEFAPMPAPAAAPMAAPAPAPAPAKTSGLWSWLPWFLSPSSLACQNMPKSACLNFTVVICHSFSCQLQKMDARHCYRNLLSLASPFLRQPLELHLWHTNAHSSYIGPDQGSG